MDCYSVESEFIESLDFLSPPVKRINSSRQGFSTYYKDTNDVHLFSDLRKKLVSLVDGHEENTQPAKISESSTSLILKRTTKGQILGEQCSVISFPSLCELERNTSTLLKLEKKANPSEKPLIKVTVIPKTDSIQAAKLLRTRRRRPIKVQSTSSNHENSIQTKNVFLIVAGRRKEKIYEIKTTGSAKLSSDHDTHSKHEDIPITELSNFKHLIQSLNMDKKKKKEKKAAVDTSDEQQTKEWQRFSEYNNCVYVSEPQESHKKSRVRIFGQLGISEDDKYVLKYGATVDDKEVMSDVAQLALDFSPTIAKTSYETIEEPLVQQRDSSVQADYNYKVNLEKPPVTATVSKETQGTQVNFNVQVATSQAKRAIFSGKKTQCSCGGNRSDNNTLKDCQSPMVIISVYPTSSPENVMKSIPVVNTQSTSQAEINTYSSNQVIKQEKTPNKSDTRRNYNSPLRSRSPSPVNKVSRPKVPDDLSKSQVSENRSPDRQKALRAIKDKIREKDKLKQESPRKFTLKSNNATQGSRKLQNVTVSNATQVSKINHRNTTSQTTQPSKINYQSANTVHGTQMSVRCSIKNNTATIGTQYSNEINSTQWDDTVGRQHTIAPVKHSVVNAMEAKYPGSRPPTTKPLKTQVSNGTQVSKPRPNAITSRMGKNQETLIPKPTQGLGKPSRLKPKTMAESGTNTEQARAKKALVETYTKKLTEQMYQQDYIPARLDNSKVTINIDDDREQYNVLFDQDNFTTGLTIRKSLKDRGTPDSIDESPLGSLFHLSGNNSPTRSPPIVPCNNPSEDELPLPKHGSGHSIHDIRDSLEICNRHAHRNSRNILKNTQTGLMAQLANNVPEDSEFSAPVKHFLGDDCSLCDPIARDKQIRELLGVKAKYCKASENHVQNNVGIPYQCIYRQRCKGSQVTEINYGCHKMCPSFDSKRPKTTASVAVQCRKNNCKEGLQKQNISCQGENIIPNGKCAVFQQLILNRYIQVFPQVELFSKQKPIILSRKQYDRVKKTIQKTIIMKKSSHVKQSKLSRIESSEISIGEVRIKKVKCLESPQKKAEDQTLEITDEGGCKKTDSITCCKPNCTHFDKTEGKSRSRKQTADVDMKGDNSGKSIDCDWAKLQKCKTKEVLEAISKPRSETVEKRHCCRGVEKVDVKKNISKKDKDKNDKPCLELNEERGAEVNIADADQCKPNNIGVKHSEVETLVLFNADHNRGYFEDVKQTEHVPHTRKTMSSVRIRYASVAYMKQLAYSSTNVRAISDTSLGHLNSFQTLFRERRKSATPNLGTSACSLYSEDGNNSENKCANLEPQDSKPKKPFLRRLMSCLVMRSAGDSELKLPVGSPPPNLPSVNSSIDSYHISTSLAAVDVSSSIYDTSASFYSNHSIHPLNSKIKKRGFFSSVRGFLINRKS